MAPWTAPSGDTYRLCLLDTTALREVVTTFPAGRGFENRFSPSSHAPCFTLYSLVEIRRDHDAFARFIEFFAEYPVVLLNSIENLVRSEDDEGATEPRTFVVLQGNSTNGKRDTKGLSDWVSAIFEDSQAKNFEQRWSHQESAILEVWLRNKHNFIPKESSPNADDAASFVHKSLMTTAAAFLPEWESRMESGQFPSPENYPSLRSMLYAQYYRLFNPSWKPRTQDVTDVRQSAYAPYVDVFVTGPFQAEVCLKMQQFDPVLARLEIATVKELSATPR